MSPSPSGPAPSPAPSSVIADVVEKYTGELVELRRDIHAHPELSWAEHRTSDLVAARLEQAGWRVRRMVETGVVADLGEPEAGAVALRADMDALPVQEVTGAPWSSTVPGVAHACGHDVHTTALLGAGLALAEVAERGELPGGGVRLVFQPAEEVMPGGAVHLLAHDVLDDVERMFALHCDPGVDVGRIGLRAGALTSAADRIEVRLEGTGGHTSRPHLTGDLTFALAKVTTELPAVISRRMDPRAGVSVVWGIVSAGSAPNVIPDTGLVAGTVRILDAVAWTECEPIIREAIQEIVRPYGVNAHVDYQRGVPPVVNEPAANAVIAAATHAVLGPHGQVQVPQSLGGEDFGWYLEQVPGAMARLGTRKPGGTTYDLHQGNLVVDERAVPIGARVLAETAVRGLLALDR